MKKLVYQIHNFLSLNTMLKSKDYCLCSVSGGQDSLLLFLLLLHLQNQWNLKITILHFNHFWQQKNFFSMQQIWKVSFVFKNPVYLIPAENLLKNEKKSRLWRQQGISRINNIENSNIIFTGHTATDRIETAFWHLIRGTSPQGFLSLKWQTHLFSQYYYFSSPIFLKKNYFNSKNYSSLFFFQARKNSIRVYSYSIFNVFKKAFNVKENIILDKKENKKINIKFQRTRKRIIKIKSQKIQNLANSCSYIIMSQYINPLVLDTRSFHQIILDGNFIGNTCDFYRTKKKINLVLKNQKQYFSFLNSIFLKNDSLKKNQTRYSFLNFFLFSHKSKILRPLLFCHRKEITFFCKKYRIPIVFDPTNQKLFCSRNRVRHQLFPILRYFFNPNTDYQINNFLEISVEEQKYIDYIMQKIIQSWLKTDFPQQYMKYQLRLVPIPIQRRLIHKLLQSYTNYTPNSLQIEKLKININKFF